MTLSPERGIILYEYVFLEEHITVFASLAAVSISLMAHFIFVKSDKVRDALSGIRYSNQ